MSEFFVYIGHVSLTAIGLVLFCVFAARLVERFTAAPAPTPAPDAEPESLDDLFARLKREAGPSFIDPVRESRIAEIRDPGAHAPTDESRALYAAFVKQEDRARRARIRRERIAAFRTAFARYKRITLRALKLFFTVGA